MTNYQFPYPSFSSVTIVTIPYCEHYRRYQYRFPKSKKKRIRRRWAKDPNNFRTKQVCKMIRAGNTIFACDLMVAEINKMVKK